MMAALGAEFAITKALAPSPIIGARTAIAAPGLMPKCASEVPMRCRLTLEGAPNQISLFSSECRGEKRKE